MIIQRLVLLSSRIVAFLEAFYALCRICTNIAKILQKNWFKKTCWLKILTLVQRSLFVIDFKNDFKIFLLFQISSNISI